MVVLNNPWHEELKGDRQGNNYPRITIIDTGLNPLHFGVRAKTPAGKCTV